MTEPSDGHGVEDVPDGRRVEEVPDGHGVEEVPDGVEEVPDGVEEVPFPLSQNDLDMLVNDGDDEAPEIATPQEPIEPLTPTNSLKNVVSLVKREALHLYGIAHRVSLGFSPTGTEVDMSRWKETADVSAGPSLPTKTPRRRPTLDETVKMVQIMALRWYRENIIGPQVIQEPGKPLSVQIPKSVCIKTPAREVVPTTQRSPKSPEGVPGTTPERQFSDLLLVHKIPSGTKGEDDETGIKHTSSNRLFPFALAPLLGPVRGSIVETPQFVVRGSKPHRASGMRTAVKRVMTEALRKYLERFRQTLSQHVLTVQYVSSKQKEQEESPLTERGRMERLMEVLRRMSTRALQMYADDTSVTAVEVTDYGSEVTTERSEYSPELTVEETHASMFMEDIPEEELVQLHPDEQLRLRLSTLTEEEFDQFSDAEKLQIYLAETTDSEYVELTNAEKVQVEKARKKVIEIPGVKKILKEKRIAQKVVFIKRRPCRVSMEDVFEEDMPEGELLQLPPNHQLRLRLSTLTGEEFGQLSIAEQMEMHLAQKTDEEYVELTNAGKEQVEKARKKVVEIPGVKKILKEKRTAKKVVVVKRRQKQKHREEVFVDEVPEEDLVMLDPDEQLRLRLGTLTKEEVGRFSIEEKMAMNLAQTTEEEYVELTDAGKEQVDKARTTVVEIPGVKEILQEKRVAKKVGVVVRHPRHKRMEEVVEEDIPEDDLVQLHEDEQLRLRLGTLTKEEVGRFTVDEKMNMNLAQTTEEEYVELTNAGKEKVKKARKTVIKIPGVKKILKEKRVARKVVVKRHPRKGSSEQVFEEEVPEEELEQMYPDEQLRLRLGTLTEEEIGKFSFAEKMMMTLAQTTDEEYVKLTDGGQEWVKKARKTVVKIPGVRKILNEKRVAKKVFVVRRHPIRESMDEVFEEDIPEEELVQMDPDEQLRLRLGTFTDEEVGQFSVEEKMQMDLAKTTDDEYVELTNAEKELVKMARKKVIEIPGINNILKEKRVAKKVFVIKHYPKYRPCGTHTFLPRSAQIPGHVVTRTKQKLATHPPVKHGRGKSIKKAAGPMPARGRRPTKVVHKKRKKRPDVEDSSEGEARIETSDMEDASEDEEGTETPDMDASSEGEERIQTADVEEASEDQERIETSDMEDASEDDEGTETPDMEASSEDEERIQTADVEEASEYEERTETPGMEDVSEHERPSLIRKPADDILAREMADIYGVQTGQYAASYQRTATKVRLSLHKLVHRPSLLKRVKHRRGLISDSGSSFATEESSESKEEKAEIDSLVSLLGKC